MVGLEAVFSAAVVLSLGVAPATAVAAISPTAALSLTTAVSPTAAVGPTVDLGYSIYEGTALANGQNQWLGIRFGAPPVGNNRFRKAQPPANTTGLQSAKEFGPVCYGLGQGISSIYGEDCLSMNIWGPSNFTAQSKLPVFFWVSGGAYIRTFNARYNGTALVQFTQNQMLFVSPNYRVGPFGFLTSEKVRANGDLNAGLYDQRVALEWVQNNIEKFGGNPRQVVIIGDSAGAGSIAMHLIAKNTHPNDLFAAIFGVSPFFPTQFFPPGLEWQFDQFARRAGCGNSTDPLACLRSLPGEQLQAVNDNMAFPGRPGNALTTWGPTIDGELIPDIPFKLFAQGKFQDVPSVWGVDTDEGTLFAPNVSAFTDVMVFINDNYPLISNSNTTRVLNTQYTGIPPRDRFAPYFPTAAIAYADITFNCPGLLLSSFFTSSSHPAWNYRYNVPTQRGIAENLGVYHMAEIPLLFGFENTNLPDPGPATYPMIPILRGYYTNFVRFLNPNAAPVPGGITWPEWVPSSRPTRLVFQVNNMTTEAVPVPGVQFNRCSAWASTGHVQQ